LLVSADTNARRKYKKVIQVVAERQGAVVQEKKRGQYFQCLILNFKLSEKISYLKQTVKKLKT
jgi:hypothetical protein